MKINIDPNEVADYRRIKFDKINSVLKLKNQQKQTKKVSEEYATKRLYPDKKGKLNISTNLTLNRVLNHYAFLIYKRISDDEDIRKTCRMFEIFLHNRLIM